MTNIDAVLSRPIFFIGVPRSGTTILFEIIARHSELGWLSGYSCSKPDRPWLNVLKPLLDNRFINVVGQKKQHGKVMLGNRYYPRPDEAYPFWDRYAADHFSKSYLVNEVASNEDIQAVRNAVKRVLFWQQKNRFSSKLTGPGRISYLKSIFPDALFINVIRDGRATINSLLNVGFWKRGGGYEQPWWDGGIAEEDLDLWKSEDKNPVVLAAIQWKAITQHTRNEAKALSDDTYMDVKYENFIDNPDDVLTSIYNFCGLNDSSTAHEYLKTAPPLKNMNHKYLDDLNAKDIDLINKILEPQLKELGYL